jgi:hypothetical protein
MIKRIGIYLNEMFPLSAFIGSILTAMSIQLIYLRLFDIKPTNYLPLITSAIVLTSVSLLIRIMDEFKDYEDDLTNFPMRPLPSGKVQKQDLVYLGFFCALMVVFLSLSSVPLLIWGTITLAFTGLMLKWFFIEKIMRKNLPLAFVTHHPIVIFNFIYLVIACMQIYPETRWPEALYVLPIALIFTNWEVVRKIRAPEQETSYTTYSKIFGPKPAILIAIILQIIFNATVLMIFQKIGTPNYLKVLFCAVQILLMFPSIKFLFTLKLNKPLKPIAETQILLVVACLLIAAYL